MKDSVAIVGGLGRVGLPFGLVLADAGLDVLLYDTDVAKAASVSRGVMPFHEDDAAQLLTRHIGGRLRVSVIPDGITEAEHVVITIGTPLDAHGNPSLIEVLETFQSILPHLHSGQHILLRSTVYPGTTRKLVELAAEKGLDVSFCPERIVQGCAIRELRALPQIVSGACDRATLLFQRLGVKTVEASIEEAEVAKLILNAWRYIRFAAANQFYEAASSLGVEYTNVQRVMSAEYPRGDIPSPGFAAGPCLLKDTLQLCAAAEFPLGRAAVQINEGLPRFVVDAIARRLGDLRGAQVGILGMAFKGDNDDTRNALSFKLRKILKFEGAGVICSDEHVRIAGLVTKENLLASVQVVIVGVPHTAYRGLRMRPDLLVVDLWNVTEGGQRL
jgi:UDP-N-acetyl-D-mannosaminuronic acid dehydrogenase